MMCTGWNVSHCRMRERESVRGASGRIRDSTAGNDIAAARRGSAIGWEVCLDDLVICFRVCRLFHAVVVGWLQLLNDLVTSLDRHVALFKRNRPPFFTASG